MVMADVSGRPTLLQSFNHAFQGLVHAVRFQRNMRTHLAVAVVVLVASVLLNLSKLELVAVIIAIVFVLMAELINSAIEAVVDLLTNKFTPQARAAKDMGAAAVLLSAINALAVAYLIMTDHLVNRSLDVLNAIRRSPTHLTIVAFGIVMALVVALKAWRGRGAALSGGLPSGHTALGFAGWTAVTFVVGKTGEGLLVSGIVFLMAVLLAQSRVETRVHSVLEVILGALLGIVATVLIFQLWF
jgi:diacylglycerol kinase (ATP)